MRRLTLSILALLVATSVSAQLPTPVPIPISPPSSLSQPPLGTQLSAQQVQGLANDNCTSARIIGSCGSQFCPDCVLLEYWQPLHAVTIVKRPGDRLIADGATMELGGSQPLSAFFPASDRPLGGGGGDNQTPHGLTNLHYSEARVYTMPQPFTIACGLCGRPDITMTVNYITDGDPHWVTAELSQPVLRDVLAPTGLGPLGVWGSLTPLGGYHAHSSMTVAAAATAAKAIWVAAVPSIPPRNVSIPAELSQCFQPAWPIKMPCMRVGFPPPLWDFAHVSPEGKYLYFFWVRRVCCMPIEATVCALAASGQGENVCDVPNLPPAVGVAATLAIYEGLRGGN